MEIKCANPGCSVTFIPKSHVHRFHSSRCRRQARSVRWGWLREAALERDEHTCQHCEATDCPIDVHHAIPVSVDPVAAAKLDALLCLCKHCHRKEHSSWEKWRNYGREEVRREEIRSYQAA